MSRRHDESMMREALKEARKGRGRTHPNPAVGAVLVKGGNIIARGWHRAAGRPHAEVEALRQTSAARGACLYVTLEPCSTHGRTPPCTDAILAAGIRRVVYGATDPNPQHAGRAQTLLERAGLAVTWGTLADECADVNKAWNKWIATGLPWVIAKAGMTLDGRINSLPESRWITCEASRRDAMKLRAEVGAILVGGETVRTDDPQLTLRGIRGVQPLRAIWSRSGNLPAKARIFTDEHKDFTRVFTASSLVAVLRQLGRDGVASVLIEGGGRTLGQAFDRKLVDEVRFYLAPVLAGGPTPAVGGRGVDSNASALRLEKVSYRRIGPDVRLSARVWRSS